MLADYVGIVVILVVGLVLAALLVGIHVVLSPAPEKSAARVPSADSAAPRRIGAGLFRVAVALVVFHTAAVFFYPWAVVFRELAWFGYGAIVAFSAPLVVAWMVQRRRGGLGG